MPDDRQPERTIFISYRRDDTEGEAGRLYDDLVRAFGDDSVFMDVSGIQPGLDFRKAIDDNVSTCGVLLAIIGPTWATISGKDGIRRLDHPDDYVRLEIGAALKRNIAVIPVLVHESQMPALEQLPDDLKDLRYRNSVELTHTRWSSDVGLLIGALKNYVHVNLARETQTVHANVPVQLPAPTTSPTDPPSVRSKWPLFAGIAFVAGIAVATMMVGSRRHPSPRRPPLEMAATNPTSTNGVQAAATAPATPAQPTTALATAAQPLVGSWQVSHMLQGPDVLTDLEITSAGGRLMVQAWGSCSGTRCPWGTSEATLQGNQATASFQPRSGSRERATQRNAKLSITVTGNTMQVTITNLYPGSNGRIKPQIIQQEFTRQQGE
ncbi:MAG TPA: toll/interleukin-1 receptor domain-containing protein [Granulicella sp.]